MAPVYADCVSASASATDAMSAVKVSVSVSSSRLDPPRGSGRVTSCDVAMSASDADSRPIGSATSRASVMLAINARPTAPSAMKPRLAIAFRVGPRDDSSIDPSA